MSEITPINEECDALLNLTLHIRDLSAEQREAIAESDPDARVHLAWRNAVITARAATVLAWIEIDEMTGGGE